MVELIKFLLKKPGYLKKSVKEVNKSLKSNYSKKEFLSAKANVRSRFKANAYNPENHVLSPVEEKRLAISSRFINYNKNNILIIPDTHFPFEREGSLEFLKEVQKEYKCGQIVHIGDVIDNAYSSFHESNPDGHSAADELEYAIEHLKPFYDTFPKAKVCLGNHDMIINRKAFSSGLSKRWIKGLDEVLETPGWTYDLEHEIFGVLFTHGIGTSGANAAYNKALNRRMSVVQGHLHSEASIRWNVSKTDIIFGMQVGCLVDDRKYAFDYAKANPRKFIISCGVLLNSGKQPIIIPMNI